MSRRSSRRRRRRGRRRLVKILIVVGVLLLGAFAVYVFYPKQSVDDRVDAFNRVSQAFNEGSYDKARLLARQYLKKYGESGDVRLVLGLASVRSGRTEEGIAQVRRAFEDDAGLHLAALFLAEHAFQQGNYAEARALARQALKASPTRTLPSAHYILGRVQSRDEMLDVTAAIRHLETAAEGELPARYRPDLFLTLARLYGIREKAEPGFSGRPPSSACLDRARDAFNALLSDEPQNEFHRIGLAKCAYRLGEFGSALAHLRQVEAGSADTPKVQLLRWMCHWKLGNDEAADVAWSEFERQDPGPDLLLEAADFYRRVGREDLSARVLANARQAHAEHIPLVVGEAARHFEAGRHREAEDILREVASRPDAKPEVIVALVSAISAQEGRQDEAEALLRARCEPEGAPLELRYWLADILLNTPPTMSGWRQRIEEAERILEPESGADATGERVEIHLQFLRAKLMYRRGLLGESLRLLRVLVTRKPDEADAHLLLADIHEEQGHPEEAIRSIDTAINLLGSSPGLLLRRGAAHLASGSAPEFARRDAEQALSVDPTNERAFLLLARGLLAEDPPDFAEAERQLLRASRTPGASGRSRLMLGRLYLSRGHPDKAQEQFLRVSNEAGAAEIRLEATTALAHLRNESANGGVNAAARRTYESFIEQNPDQVDAQIRYAYMLMENGDKAAAREWVARVIDGNPENVDARILLFEICLAATSQEGLDRAGAEKALSQVERIEPEGPEVVYLRGRLALVDDDLETAIAAFREAAVRAPRNAQVAYHLGAAEYLADDITRARNSLEKALRLNPRNLQARVLLADVAYREGREMMEAGDETTREDALRRFRYALERNPGHLGSLAYIVQSFFAAGPSRSRVEMSAARRQTEALLRRLEAMHTLQPKAAYAERLTKLHRLHGAICYAQEDWESLVRSCKRCLEITPGESGALLRMGLALMAAGRSGDAVDYVSRAREASPSSWTVLSTLTELHLAAGRPGEAVPVLQQWSANHPGDFRAFLLLGRVQTASGELDEAAGSFEECLRLNANEVEAADRLARLQAGRGRAGDAEAAIRAILPGTRRKGEMKFILGSLLLGEDLTSESGIDTLRSALRDGVGDPGIRVGCTVLLLRALVASDRHADAVGVSRRFADWFRKKGPFAARSVAGLNAPEVFSLGGISLAKTGMRDLSESFYREAVNLKPDFAQALNNLADLLGKAPATERGAKLDEMMELAKRAVELDAGQPAYRDTLGSALLMAGKVPEAIRAFEESLELCRSIMDGGVGNAQARALRRLTGRTWLHLSVALFDAGRLQESREALRRSTAEYPGLRDEEEYLEAAAKIGL